MALPCALPRCAGAARPSSRRISTSAAAPRCVARALPRHATLPAAPAAARRALRAHTLRVVAIGFQTEGGSVGGSRRVEKRAESVLRAASSLLLYQQALAGDIPQAFLKVLAALRLGRDGGMPALSSYGAFFAKLAADGRAWPDVLLDAVIGCDNAFTRDAAAGKPTSQALRSAVAADLEALQQLCVLESVLAEWVHDAEDSPEAGARDDWLAASAAIGAAHDEGELSAAERAAASASLDAALDEAADASDGEALGMPVGAPLSAGEARAARDRLRLRPRWRDGVRDLEAWHRRFGAGAAAAASVLTWRDAALAPAPQWLLPTAAELDGTADAMVLAQHADTLAKHHSRGAGGSLLLHGPSSSRTAWALLRTQPAVRVVALARGDIKSMGAVCDAMRAHPRTRFAVLLDGLALVPFGEAYNELAALVLASGALPHNAMLVAAAATESALRPGEGSAAAAMDGPLTELWRATAACNKQF